MKQKFFLLNSFDVEIFKLLWHNNKHSYRKLSGTINFAIWMLNEILWGEWFKNSSKDFTLFCLYTIHLMIEILISLKTEKLNEKFSDVFEAPLILKTALQ